MQSAYAPSFSFCGSAGCESATFNSRILGIYINAARNFKEKEEPAKICVRKLDIGFTTVVDNFDAKVEKDYGGHPDRL